MTEAARIVIGSLSVFAALGIACAVWLAFRGSRGIGRQVLASSPVDPYFHPFGEMPTMPQLSPGYFDRQMIVPGNVRETVTLKRSRDANDVRCWGIPESTSKPSACALPRMPENDGHASRKSPVSKSLSSGPAVVLNFRKVQP